MNELRRRYEFNAKQELVDELIVKELKDSRGAVSKQGLTKFKVEKTDQWAFQYSNSIVTPCSPVTPPLENIVASYMKLVLENSAMTQSW